MDHYGVMGNPISQSKSPLIHRLFAEQTNQLMSYRSMLVELDGLSNALDEFQASGGRGLNITLPFKHRAYTMVDECTPRALRAEAINTIIFQPDGKRVGDNTDGIGLMTDIVKNRGFDLKNKRILLLGAGGAVSGMMEALLNEEPADLIICNRTMEKAFDLAKQFANFGPIAAYGLNKLVGQHFDLIINGTSASLQGELIDLPLELLENNPFCYDIGYGKGMPPFLHWVRHHGVTQAADGMGMLVEQAAESFFLWRNVRPDTRVVLTLLRATQEEFLPTKRSVS